MAIYAREHNAATLTAVCASRAEGQSNQEPLQQFLSEVYLRKQKPGEYKTLANIIDDVMRSASEGSAIQQGAQEAMKKIDEGRVAEGGFVAASGGQSGTFRSQRNPKNSPNAPLLSGSPQQGYGTCL